MAAMAKHRDRQQHSFDLVVIATRLIFDISFIYNRMLSRVANGLRSQSGRRLLRNVQQQTKTQRRNMGGGGA